MMGPTDDHLPTVDPRIQQRGQLRVAKLMAGIGDPDSSRRLGEDCAYALSRCRMGRWAIRVVSQSAGEGDRTRHISGHVQGGVGDGDGKGDWRHSQLSWTGKWGRK